MSTDDAEWDMKVTEECLRKLKRATTFDQAMEVATIAMNLRKTTTNQHEQFRVLLADVAKRAIVKAETFKATTTVRLARTASAEAAQRSAEARAAAARAAQREAAAESRWQAAAAARTADGQLSRRDTQLRLRSCTGGDRLAALIAADDPTRAFSSNEVAFWVEMRQWLEAKLGVQPGSGGTLFARLQDATARATLDPNLAGEMHKVRMKANQIVHQGGGSGGGARPPPALAAPPAAAADRLLGAALLSSPGATPTATPTALRGKDFIGLYFSAHWGPPCREYEYIYELKGIYI